MKKGQRRWTRDELILTINLYFKLPFGRLHRLNPEVISLANLIDRTPSAVAFKLVNFASLDPSLQARGIKGAKNTSKLDREVWGDFFHNWNSLPFESEQLLAQYNHTTVENINGILEESLPIEGKEREQTVRVRVNQSFFRKSILSSYNDTCCITGINNPDFLIAGHIRPWSLDVSNRMNPRNGIAINALHDKAFELGYITITPDYKIKVSPIIPNFKNEVYTDYFTKYDGKEIILPSRFLPDPDFLTYHNQERFKH